eukprot:3753944-Alexandrium_andersonii.AAC.1
MRASSFSAIVLISALMPPAIRSRRRRAVAAAAPPPPSSGSCPSAPWRCRCNWRRSFKRHCRQCLRTNCWHL